MPAQDAANRSAYMIGAVIGGIFVGALCGLLPYCIAKRRGRQGLGYGALAACTLAGFVLGILLALPTAIVFTVVALVLPARRQRTSWGHTNRSASGLGKAAGVLCFLVTCVVAFLVTSRMGKALPAAVRPTRTFEG